VKKNSTAPIHFQTTRSQAFSVLRSFTSSALGFPRQVQTGNAVQFDLGFKRKFLPLVIFSAALNATATLAQDDAVVEDAPVLASSRLTVESPLHSLQKALGYDAEFLNARAQFMASRETVTQAWASIRPTVSFDAERIETEQDIVSSDNTVFDSGSTDFPTTTYTLTLTQPLFHWEHWVRLDQAKAETRRADAEMAIARQDLILRVVERYLAALAAQDNLLFAQKEEAAIERQLQDAEVRYNSQIARRVDVLDAQSRYKSVVASRILAENDLDDALEALREVRGQGGDNLAPLNDKLTYISPEPAEVSHWMEAAVSGNINIQLLQHDVETSRLEVKRQRSGHYPTVDFSARFNNQDTDGTLFGGGSEVETTDLLVRVNVPIYQGGAVSSRTTEAAYLYEAKMAEMKQQVRAVERETRAAYHGVKSAIARVESLQQAVAAQALVAETKKAGFPRVYTNIEVLDAERDLYSAKRDYAQARYDYILGSIRLKQATGTLTDEDIVVMNQWFNH